MQPPPTIPFTELQIARRLRWLELALIWLTGLICGHRRGARFEYAPQTGRARRRLWSFLWRAHGEDWAKYLLMRLGRILACLIFLRAFAMARVKPGKARSRPPNAPRGFARKRPTPGVMLRACIGSTLRRRLRARGLADHLGALFAGIRDADALARALVRRLARRMTRLNPILPVHPPREAAAGLAAPAVNAADTS